MITNSPPTIRRQPDSWSTTSATIDYSGGNYRLVAIGSSATATVRRDFATNDSEQHTLEYNLALLNSGSATVKVQQLVGSSYVDIAGASQTHTASGSYTLTFTPTQADIRVVVSGTSRFALTQIFLDRTHLEEVTETYLVKAGGYRYGFNGMEKDDEVKGNGNSYDFGARMYDCRLGRWLTIDPLAGKYPNLSPYNFVANSPIVLVDPDGKDIEPIGKTIYIDLYITQLRSATSLDIRYNAFTGKLQYFGTPKGKIAQKVAEIIDDPNKNVQMYVTNAKQFEFKGVNVELMLGSFLGNSIDGSGRYVAQQIINPLSLQAAEKLGVNKIGAGAAHETIEAAVGIEMHPGYTSTPQSNKKADNDVSKYEEIHQYTTKQYVGAESPEYDDELMNESNTRIWFKRNPFNHESIINKSSIKLDSVPANFDVLKKITIIERAVKVEDKLNTK